MRKGCKYNMQIDFIQKIFEIEGKVDNLQIERARRAIKRVLTYYNSTLERREIKEVIKRRENLLKQEDKDIIEYNQIIDSIGGLQIQNSVAKYLLQNPQIAKEIYDRVINMNFTIEDRPFYTVDIKKSSEMLIKQIVDDLRKSKADVTLENIKYVLQNFGDISDTHLKQYYIELLDNAWIFLQRYEFIDFYIERSNSNIEKVGLEGLKIEDKQVIDEEFSKENMKKMTMEELILLNTYYQNRLTKEKRQIYDAIFYIEQLNLWDNSAEIDEETLKNVIAKKNMVDMVNEEYKRRKDEQNHISKIKRYRDDYKEYFTLKFPEAENDLADDCMQTLYGNLHSRKIYDTKLDLTFKLFEMMMNKTKINWGYIPKEDDDKFILLGIDYPGYNMPMTIHMKKETLVQFLSGMEMTTVPIYKGHEDILIGGKVFPTNILYKMQDDKKEYIVSKAKELKKVPNSHKHPDFIHHINAMAKGIMPYNHKEKRQYINISNLGDEEPEGRE